MQVKSIAECSKHSAILSTFIKLPFVIKFFVLSIFEWLLKTGFTVLMKNVQACKKLNMHLQLSSRARGLFWGLRLDLPPYYVYLSNEGLDETAQPHLSLGCMPNDKHQNFTCTVSYYRYVIFYNYFISV